MYASISGCFTHEQTAPWTQWKDGMGGAKNVVCVETEKKGRGVETLYLLGIQLQLSSPYSAMPMAEP
jgi:hypothetical protein